MNAERWIILIILAIVAMVGFTMWDKSHHPEDYVHATVLRVKSNEDAVEEHLFSGSNDMPTVYVWHDDKRKVTCYTGVMAGHGTAMQCLPDAYIATGAH